jgi:nucleoside-diphosphate-sugar epimerase
LIITFAVPKQWCYRLGVRTSGFHPGNRGSIPRSTTTETLTLVRVFYFNPMNKKTALLIGSTGLIGNYCLHLLLDDNRYEKVIAISRKELSVKNPKLENIITDLDTIVTFTEKLKADDYFCCLGTTIKIAGSQENFRKVDETYVLAIAKIAEKHNAKAFCVVSAMGANEQSSIFYNAVKGSMENQLKKLQINYIGIFRPSLLLGERKENRTAEKIGEYFLQFFKIISLGLAQNLYAIHGKKVAKAMIEKANSSKIGVEIILSGQIQ